MELEKEAEGNREELIKSMEPIEKETVEEQIDYKDFKKEDFANFAEKLLKESDIKKIEALVKPLKVSFDELKEHEKQHALQKFIEEGGAEGDFELKNDEFTTRFEQAFRSLKERKYKLIQEQEKLKSQNLATKQELLEKLRHLVDSEETHDSFLIFKQIQQQWKSVGNLPVGNLKDLWASYESLVERYLSNRSIYRELKELDQKKNAILKAELCERAEKLAEQEITGNQMRDLNDLHEEYKHIGPATKEEQEKLWQRFKLASDKLYDKRRKQLDGLKGQMDENYLSKISIIEQIEQNYSNYTSDKINEWNDKTKELLDLQKRWEAVGNLSREKAKEVSKRFWNSFKQFFNNKAEFFRKLEEFREKNLQEKIKLCEEAEALKENSDFDKTADKIKSLQKRWKDIGPVPEKQRNSVFDRFKAACDEFFNNKRGKLKEAEEEYEQNLKIKEGICEEIEKLIEEKSSSIPDLKKLQVAYNNAGFVPRKDMEAIRNRYSSLVEKFLESISLKKEEKDTYRLQMDIESAQSDPQAKKKIEKQEIVLRKKLTQLENDVAVWQNNREFFARSKNADAMLSDFNKKIKDAEMEIESIKKQIKLMFVS